MRLGFAGVSYEWVEDWARYPRTETARTGWSHHGIAASRGGRIVSFHPADRTLMVLDVEGNLLWSHETELTEGHGMTLVEEADGEHLWVADNGSKRQPGLNYEYPPDAARTSGKVVKMDLNGRTLMTLRKPDLEDYRTVRFAPTCVAVNEERFGGNGDVWVADGYGLSYVHRFDKHGRYAGGMSGAEGAGRFDTPHAVFVDRRRRGSPELLVADRANRRVQVYDMEGKFVRTFGSDFLSSPSNFAVDGDYLIVGELRARLAVVDMHDSLVGYLGDNEEVCGTEGWPNRKDAKGNVLPTDRLRPGKFNSPHGLTVDGSGNIYVAEWLIGERTIKLVKNRP